MSVPALPAPAWLRRPSAVALGVVGLAAFVWLVPLQLGWYGGGSLGDVPLYQDVAARMAARRSSASS